MKAARALTAGVALAAATAAVVWWLGTPGLPGAAPPPPPPGAAAAPGGGVSHTGLSQSAQPMPDSFFTASRTATTGHSADPLLVHGLRDTLEALLLEARAEDAGNPAALKQRLAALVGQHFPAELATRALALAERYVDYRVALGQLRPPADPLDPHAMRQALEQRQKLRLQHFDGDEYEALFGQQQLLDQALLTRLEIERNTALSAEEKRKALAETEAQLPAPLRAQRSESVAHVGAAQQTAAFNAQRADDATRFAQRSATYGAEAAERLARLDREERDWNARLDQYQQARSAGQDAARLDQLRQTLFTPEEQLRLEGALGLRSPAQNR